MEGRRVAVAYVGKDAAKGAGERCGAEEEGDAVMLLVALVPGSPDQHLPACLLCLHNVWFDVPHRQVKHHAREQATLRHAEHEADHEEAGHVLCHAHQRRDHPPRQRQRREPPPRRRLLQHDVARDLEQDVADEVQRQARQVLVPRHVQIRGQAVEPRVGDVAAVEEREQVQQRHRRQELQVELPQQGLLFDAGRVVQPILREGDVGVGGLLRRRGRRWGSVGCFLHSGCVYFCGSAVQQTTTNQDHWKRKIRINVKPCVQSEQDL